MEKSCERCSRDQVHPFAFICSGVGTQQKGDCSVPEMKKKEKAIAPVAVRVKGCTL